MYFKALSMKHNPQEDIALIRSMMERSTRFISLSGLSGVFAGIFALIACGVALWVFKRNGINYFEPGGRSTYPSNVTYILVIICILTLLAAIGTAVFLSYRKGKKHTQKIWNKLTIRFLASLAIPLIAGGFFCIGLYYNSQFSLIAPAMLIFYGLSLINAAKYTYSDIGYLGYTELFLGLVSVFYLGSGLLFWAFGFGILHIIYGIAMYKKYQ